MKRLLLTLLMLVPAIANADAPTAPLSRNLITGNALVTPESIQKIVKAIIVKNLGKTYDTESSSSGLRLQIEGADYQLKIPEKPALHEILNTLGIADQLNAKIDPIQTTINFSPDS